MTDGLGWNVRPGESVGPLVLGMPEEEVTHAIGEPMSRKNRREMTSLDYGFITIMLFQGVVTMIVIEMNAQIEVAECGIKPGALVRDLVSFLESPLTYDQEEGLWRSADLEGLWFEVARPAEAGEDPIEPPYVPEQYDITRPESALVRRVFVQ
ncbi:MAG: hypothetical protein WBA45_03300 [Microthrixaceae bacterium]